MSKKRKEIPEPVEDEIPITHDKVVICKYLGPVSHRFDCEGCTACAKEAMK